MIVHKWHHGADDTGTNGENDYEKINCDRF